VRNWFAHRTPIFNARGKTFSKTHFEMNSFGDELNSEFTKAGLLDPSSACKKPGIPTSFTECTECGPLKRSHNW
jgi:hypothetical protein